MAEIKKYEANTVLKFIRHNHRELPPGKTPGNEDIDPSLTNRNYSLLDGRCQNATEANRYRKKIEKEIFKYKRKNLVHAVELVVQCPSDCPEEQKEDFFKETFKYVCSTLPMGERCVFVAQVHKDERMYSHTGQLISKDHLHIMYVPGVPDQKHECFKYKLCADQLTKKARLKEFHPNLQQHLIQAGIQATVFRKKATDGKNIALSVKQLKQLTNLTGITLDHSLTVEELAQIINSNILHAKQLEAFQTELTKKESLLKSIQETPKDSVLDEKSFQTNSSKKNTDFSYIKLQNEELKARIKTLEKSLEAKSAELETAIAHEHELIAKIDQLHAKESTTTSAMKEPSWGHESEWGSVSGWGSNTQNKTFSKEAEKEW